MLFALSFDFITQRRLGQVTQGVHLVGYLVGILWVIFTERNRRMVVAPDKELLAEKAKVSGYHSLTKEEREQLK